MIILFLTRNGKTFQLIIWVCHLSINLSSIVLFLKNLAYIKLLNRLILSLKLSKWISVCLSVCTEGFFSYQWTDIVLLEKVTSHRSWEGTTNLPKEIKKKTRKKWHPPKQFFFYFFFLKLQLKVGVDYTPPPARAQGP